MRLRFRGRLFWEVVGEILGLDWGEWGAREVGRDRRVKWGRKLAFKGNLLSDCVKVDTNCPRVSLHCVFPCTSLKPSASK